MASIEWDLQAIVRVYAGSDGQATTGLYEQLGRVGPAGLVALNVFRAMKCSERAKVYRGGNGRGSYRNQAYGRKQWSIDNLDATLRDHGDTLGIRWGWAQDPEQAYHCWVLYVELPTGQVSFHTDRRGAGPDYPDAWDGVRDAGPGRISRWCASLLVPQFPVEESSRAGA